MEQPRTCPADAYRDPERMVAFSDAIFAFAITLLALDIRVPTNLVGRELDRWLIQLLPRLLPYAVSFVVVAIYWVVHHRMFRFIKSYNHVLIWLNLMFLLIITLMPFLSGLLSWYGDRRMVVIIYDISLTVAGIFLVIMWWYSTAGWRFVDPEVGQELVNYYLARSLAAPLVYLLSIIVSVFSVPAAKYCWILVIVSTSILRRIYKADIC